MNGKCTLVVENVSFSYRRKHILSEVSFHVDEGEVLGIVGLNGIGKTTLMKLILGFLPTQKGTVYIKNNDSPSFAGFIETPKFWNYMTGLDNAKYYLRDKFDRNSVERQFQLWNISDALNCSVGKYSLGMKQKLAIIIAMESNADIFLFDEPTNTLDYESARFFYKQIALLKQQKKIILIISHDISELKINASKMICKKNGRVEKYLPELLDVKFKYRISLVSKEAAQEATKNIDKINEMKKFECPVHVLVQDCHLWICVLPRYIPEILKQIVFCGVTEVIRL